MVQHLLGRRGVARIALIPRDVLDALSVREAAPARHACLVRPGRRETGPDAIAHRLAVHTSDVARCRAAQWVSFSVLDLGRKLDAVRRFAADPHFGVLEMAWTAVRDEVGRDIDGTVQLLQPWVHKADPNLRRFATELTRPHGVWCAPLPALKAAP